MTVPSSVVTGYGDDHRASTLGRQIEAVVDAEADFGENLPNDSDH